MNGVHDMGGMHGFGPVIAEKNEPVFHATWEGRAYALNRAMGVTGYWNIDMSRYAQEILPAQVYLKSSYYARWTRSLEQLLLRFGLVAPDELAAGHALHPPLPVKRRLTVAEVARALTRASYARTARAPAKYAVGDRVRAKNINPATHTRLPRYARGHLGVVEAIRGCHVFPDSTTTGGGEDPHWLYTVVFTGPELWGPQSDPSLKVSIEAWEPYLDAA
jgi:nitrile hydratase beta subunit